MQRWEQCRKIIHLHQPDQTTLVYSILVDGGGAGCFSYGLEISCPERAECAAMQGLTFSRPVIERVLDMLASSFVPPDRLSERTAGLLP